MAIRSRNRGYGALTGYLPARSTQRAPFPSLAGGGINTRSKTVLQGNMAGRPLVQRQTPMSQPRPVSAPPASADGGIAEALQKLRQSTQQGDLTPKAISYNYATDPLLQQVAALGTQSRQGAESGALALRKQTAIDYGDEALARTFGDEATAVAARNNPNSVRAQLQKSYEEAQRDLENQYNESNLFYGGARIKGLADLATTLTNQQAQAAGEQQKTLSGIEEQRLSAIRAADAADLQAQQEAYNRALEAEMGMGYGDYQPDWDALIKALGGSGGGGDGNPVAAALTGRASPVLPYAITRPTARAPVRPMATPPRQISLAQIRTPAPRSAPAPKAPAAKAAPKASKPKGKK